MPRTHPTYPPEFRRDAISLARSSGESISKVAHDLGVSPQSLRNWIKQDEIDAGKREGLTTEERDELRALRRKVKTLEMEREILKKATAFFARESETR